MATQEVDNLVPAMNNFEIVDENQVKSTENGIETPDNKWNLPMDDVYKLALRFYKDKEGSKALHVSYKERVRLVAYTKQVMFGKYRADVSPEVGFLDVVGNDRRQAWLALGDLPKEDAMNEFVKYLDQLCPLFTPYIEAHKAEKADQERQRQEEEVRAAREEEDKERSLLEEEVRQRQEDDRNRQAQQELAIRAALNQQTASQFKQYAEQQYPANLQQQEALITQLQEQHFQQYMQQVYQQQLLHQQQQYQQLQAMATDPQKEQQQQQQQQQEQQQPPEQQILTPEANLNTTQTTISQAVTGNGLDPKTSPGAQVVANNVADGHVMRASMSGDDDEDNDQNLPPIAAASMWTRKDIKEFKESIKKDPDSLIKVGSGETVTVRVPTHEDGTCLFWEFATDSYDVGFGVYFEWTIAPNNQVSVHVSESSDEEDIDEDEGGEKPEAGSPGDIEKGKKPDNRPPTDEIIPVYRRDCHEEVYCGSHMYPGRGVYLLKFDNSYSLWRSKTLYYRVYYTR